MLRPHHREDAEFHKVRLAPQRMEDALVFLGGKAVLFDDFGGDGGHVRDSLGRPLDYCSP